MRIKIWLVFTLCLHFLEKWRLKLTVNLELITAVSMYTRLPVKIITSKFRYKKTKIHQLDFFFLTFKFSNFHLDIEWSWPFKNDSRECKNTEVNIMWNKSFQPYGLDQWSMTLANDWSTFQFVRRDIFRQHFSLHFWRCYYHKPPFLRRHCCWLLLAGN